MKPSISENDRALPPVVGEYIAFTYFQAAGCAAQSFRREFQVGSVRTPIHRLLLTGQNGKFGAYDVTLTTDPEPPMAGQWTTVRLHITHVGQPVTNLDPRSTRGARVAAH